MAKWNDLALKLLMLVMGVLLVMGSGLGVIGGSLFPVDSWVGVTASVAGRGVRTGSHDCRLGPDCQHHNDLEDRVQDQCSEQLVRSSTKSRSPVRRSGDFDCHHPGGAAD